MRALLSVVPGTGQVGVSVGLLPWMSNEPFSSPFNPSTQMGVVSFVAAAFTVTGIVLGPIRPLNGFTTEPEAVPETVGPARLKLAAIVVASVCTNLMVLPADPSFAIVSAFKPP